MGRQRIMICTHSTPSRSSWSALDESNKNSFVVSGGRRRLHHFQRLEHDCWSHLYFYLPLVVCFLHQWTVLGRLVNR